MECEGGGGEKNELLLTDRRIVTETDSITAIELPFIIPYLPLIPVVYMMGISLLEPSY